MKPYRGNEKPYIYAIFSDKQDQYVSGVLDELGKSGILFWRGEKYDAQEKKYLASAHAVMVFLSNDLYSEKWFRQLTDWAVMQSKNILCVYLEPVKLDPWGEMQLNTQQSIRMEQYPVHEDLIGKLKEAEIFRAMAVTTAQKKLQRNRGIVSVAVPVIAASLIFATVVYPLLIAPNLSLNSDTLDTLGFKGLTKNDLESIAEIRIVGNVVSDTFVNCWYEDQNRTVLYYDQDNEENGNKETKGPIETGTLSDISDLEMLVNLKELQIEGQQIKDITPLFKLKNLSELWLNCNPVSSLEGIDALTELTHISLADTDISDISPLLSCENLIHLQVEKTYVTDLSGIENLKNLKTLMIAGTSIRTVPDLGYRESFSLDARETDLKDLSFLQEAVSFNEISIDGMSFDRVLPYISGKPIQSLAWASVPADTLNDISDIEIAQGGRLDLAWNRLQSLDGIENFEGISYLGLKHASNLTDLTPVLSLESLEILCVSSDMKYMADEQLAGTDLKIEYRDD